MSALDRHIVSKTVSLQNSTDSVMEVVRLLMNVFSLSRKLVTIGLDNFVELCLLDADFQQSDVSRVFSAATTSPVRPLPWDSTCAAVPATTAYVTDHAHYFRLGGARSGVNQWAWETRANSSRWATKIFRIAVWQILLLLTLKQPWTWPWILVL